MEDGTPLVKGLDELLSTDSDNMKDLPDGMMLRWLRKHYGGTPDISYIQLTTDGICPLKEYVTKVN